MKRVTLCMMVCIGWANAYADEVFHAPVRVTDSMANHRMTANPARVAAFDAQGQLHATWWTGELATTPSTPSQVLYASWNAAQGWSEPEAIDDSIDGGGIRVGGRNPSLAIAGDGSVWVTWQDHRHCRGGAPYNWIDNMEIYADRKPVGGAFSATDLRLTTTTAAHFGDNGYTPRILGDDDGNVRVVWYDFHFNSGVSDIFQKIAPSGGSFNLTESMADMRISRYEDRPIGPPFGPAALSHPELIATPTGDWFVIWTEGFGLPGPLLVSPMPTPGEYLGPGQTVAVFSDGYNNAASMDVALDGSLWIGWTDRLLEVPRVALRRRDAATGALDAAWFLTDGSQRAEGLSFAIDATGLIHATWCEVESYQQNRIRYALFDPDSRSIVREETLTPDAGAYVKPCLVLDGASVPHVLFGEYYGDAPGDIGDIWHAVGIAPPPKMSDVFFLF